MNIFKDFNIVTIIQIHLSVTSNDMDKMNLSIGSYCGILKNIYKII